MSNTRICSIDGCGKPLFAMGWCSTHYYWLRHNRQRKKIAQGEAERFFRASLLMDTDDCIIWPYAKVKGYGQIGRGLVHRLACIEKHGEPPTAKHEAAHSCNNGAGACINWKHVSWKTRKENEEDKLLNGTRLRGIQLWNAKLNDDAVRSMRIRHANGEKIVRLAEEYGVTDPVALAAIYRKKWKHVL